MRYIEDLPQHIHEGLKEALEELEGGEGAEVSQEYWDEARRIVQKRKEQLELKK